MEVWRNPDICRLIIIMLKSCNHTQWTCDWLSHMIAYLTIIELTDGMAVCARVCVCVCFGVRARVCVRVCACVWGVCVWEPTHIAADVTVTKIAGYVRVRILMNRWFFLAFILFTLRPLCRIYEYACNELMQQCGGCCGGQREVIKSRSKTVANDYRQEYHHVYGLWTLVYIIMNRVRSLVIQFGYRYRIDNLSNTDPVKVFLMNNHQW